MPVGRKYDIQIGGNGYMLSRATQTRGRAWQRTGQPDTPGPRPRAAELLGALPDQIDRPEVWNDWSGGFGYPYRQPKDSNSYFGFYENPNRFHWSENMDARFPHQLVHCQQMQMLAARYASLATNAVTVVDSPAGSLANAPAGFGGIFVGNQMVRTRLFPTGLAAAGSAFDLTTLTIGTQGGAGRPAIFGSFIYFSTPDGSAFGIPDADSLNDTGTPGWGPPVSGNVYGYAWAAAGNRLWRAWGAPGGGRRVYLSNTAGSPPNPGDWSATLSVGNGAAQINDLRPYKEQVFVGMEDGLYAGDATGTFVNVLNDLAGNTDADNCRDIAIHEGQVVVQHVAGVYAYNPSITTTGQVQEIGPNLLSNRSPISGKVRALEALGPWLYAALWTGSQSYLLAGREDREQANAPYVWFPMQRFPHVARPQRIHVDGITTSSGNLRNLPQRMWAATDPSIGAVGTAPLYWWPIPLLNGDPLAAQNAWSANYVGSARIDLGIVDGRAPATAKLYRSVTIESENLGSPSLYCDVYYTVDGGTRTLLGRAIDSPRSVLYFPSAQGSFVTGYSIELSLQSFTATAGLSPVYRSIVMRSSSRPSSVDLITAVIDVADETRDRQDIPMRPGATQLAELRAFSVQGAAVTLIDLAGATNVVEVLAPVEEQEVYQAGNDNPYLAATVKLAVLTFT